MNCPECSKEVPDNWMSIGVCSDRCNGKRSARNAATEKAALTVFRTVDPKAIQQESREKRRAKKAKKEKLTPQVVRAKRLGYENYFTNPEISKAIFAKDMERPEEELVTELLGEFNTAETSAFMEPREPKGQKKEVVALFRLRDIAIERYFMRHSATFNQYGDVVSVPQTKRHMYYKCKGKFCGIDHSDVDDYFSNAIAGIIRVGCWAGRIPFYRVREEGRTLVKPSGSTDAKEALVGAVEGFKINLAKTQPTRLIITTEKDAVIESVSSQCWNGWVPYQSTHGQNSDSGVYQLATTISDWGKEGCTKVVVGVLTDNDNGGISIQESVFSKESDEDEDGEPHGRLVRMLKKFFPNAPEVVCERLGMNDEDLTTYADDVIPMDLLTKHKDKTTTVNRKKIANMRAFINKQNPWFNQFSKEDVAKMEETKLRSYVDNLKVITLGVDVLSAEEINLRVEKFIAKHRADGAKQWADQQLIEVVQQGKLDHILDYFDEIERRGTLSTCKCGRKIIYKKDEVDQTYCWLHIDDDDAICRDENGEVHGLAEPVGRAEYAEEDTEDVPEPSTEDEEDAEYVPETEGIHVRLDSVCKYCGDKIDRYGGNYIGWMHTDKYVADTLINEFYLAEKKLCVDGKHNAEPVEEAL